MQVPPSYRDIVASILSLISILLALCFEGFCKLDEFLPVLRFVEIIEKLQNITTQGDIIRRLSEELIYLKIHPFP